MADFNSGRVWAAWASTGLNSSPEQIENLKNLCNKWREKGLVATDAIGGWPGGFEHGNLNRLRDPQYDMLRLTDKNYREIFESTQYYANENSQKENPTGAVQVDPYLHCGGLMNKACGLCLEIATDEVIFPPVGESIISTLWEKYKIDYIAIHYGYARTYLYWDKEKVQSLKEKADWDKVRKVIAEKKAPIAIFHSAKGFLEACAQANLGIRFSSQ